MRGFGASIGPTKNNGTMLDAGLGFGAFRGGVEMNRVTFTMKLNPGMKDEYKRRHDEIWPELAELLRNSGISDYSISLDEATNTLFACQKVSGGGSSQDLGSLPIVQKWWAYMADIMETNPDNSPAMHILEELFYME
jgi:L-rhamnose mutarotase